MRMGEDLCLGRNSRCVRPYADTLTIGASPAKADFGPVFERIDDVDTKPTSKAALWLLVIPYIGLLWVPFYNFSEPSLFGFPFFYWYQLAWVPITAFLIWIAYRSVRHDD